MKKQFQKIFVFSILFNFIIISNVSAIEISNSTSSPCKIINYSNTWSTCTNGIQTRSVQSMEPKGCILTSLEWASTKRTCTNGVSTNNTTVTPATVNAKIVSNTSSNPVNKLLSTNLKIGATGEEVKLLQSKLKEKGYFVGETTLKFGSITERAVKALQKANNLSADGIVGPLTRAILNK